MSSDQTPPAPPPSAETQTSPTGPPAPPPTPEEEEIPIEQRVSATHIAMYDRRRIIKRTLKMNMEQLKTIEADDLASKDKFRKDMDSLISLHEQALTARLQKKMAIMSENAKLAEEDRVGDATKAGEASDDEGQHEPNDNESKC